MCLFLWQHQRVHCSCPVNQISYSVTFLFLIIWLGWPMSFEIINFYCHVKIYVSRVNPKPIETNEKFSKPFIRVPILYYAFVYIWVSPLQEFESNFWQNIYDGTNYFYLAIFNELYDTQMAARFLRWFSDSNRRENCAPLS